MLKPIRKWLLDNSLYFAFAISLGIILLSLINTAVIPKPKVLISDKLMHAFAYLVLFWSWKLFYRDKKVAFNWYLVLFLIVFGIILEVLQGVLTDYRTADYQDALANTTGILIGFFSFKLMYKTVFGAED